MDTAQIISAKRAELGLSRQEFADLLGVNGTTVWRWETSAAVPSVFVLAYIYRLPSSTHYGLKPKGTK